MAKLLILNKGSNLVLKSEIEVVSILVMLNKIFETLMSNLERFDQDYQLYKILLMTTHSCKNNKDGSYVVLTILCDNSFI